jgi:histone acetyltransferase (RNA polymerase elongator complex component)
MKEKIATYRQKAETAVEAAFYGSTFTGLPVTEQECWLREAGALKDCGMIQKIRLSTRPDFLDQATVERLVRFRVDTVELGVQSLIEGVLRRTGRGHGTDCVRESTLKLREAGIQVIYQLMLGLPGDTPARARLSARRAAALKPDGVRFSPTLVLEGTALAQGFRAGLYRPWSLEDAVEVGADYLAVFESRGIPVIRMGLQDSVLLTQNQAWVGGPHHPAYGELVKSRLQLAQMRLLAEMGRLDRGRPREIRLCCHPRELSQRIGQRRVNVEALRRDWPQHHWTWETDPGLAPGECVLWDHGQACRLKWQDFLDRYRIGLWVKRNVR